MQFCQKYLEIPISKILFEFKSIYSFIITDN